VTFSSYGKIVSGWDSNAHASGGERSAIDARCDVQPMCWLQYGDAQKTVKSDRDQRTWWRGSGTWRRQRPWLSVFSRARGRLRRGRGKVGLEEFSRWPAISHLTRRLLSAMSPPRSALSPTRAWSQRDPLDCRPQPIVS